MRNQTAPSAVRSGSALGLVLGIAVFLTAVQTTISRAETGITPQRQQELLYLLQQDCGSCHGLSMKGGLGSPLLPETLADKPDDALVEIILHGLPGTPMPPWNALLREEEAAFLVRAMKSGQTLKMNQ